MQAFDEEQLRQVQVEATEAQAVASAWSLPVAPVSVTDKTRNITVKLDESGQLSQIRIGDSWHQSYAPETLDAAIVATYSEAVVKQMQLRKNNFDAAQATRTHYDFANDAIRQERTASESTAEEAYSRLKALDSLLDDFLREIESATEQAEKTAKATYSGKCTGNMVQIDLDSAGGLASVRFTDRWLDRATGFAINLAIKDALEKAKQAQIDGQVVDPSSPLGKLQSLVEEVKEY